MYEVLISHLRDCAKLDPYENTFTEAADAIERLIAFNAMWQGAAEFARENKPKWIPVTERLPKEENRSYWICTDTGYQCECRWTNNYFGIVESGEWGWCIVDVPQYHKVVAWMDLPKPYKPPKEET